jgi:PST family polysaccharide transporter
MAPAGIGPRLAKGITALYLVQLFSLPLGVVTNLLAGRILVPADYGNFATSVFVVTLVGMLSDASLGTALIRDPGRLGRRDLASVFSFQLAAGAVVAVALFLGSHALEGVFGPESGEISAMIRRLCAIPVLSAFATVPIVLSERELSYGRIAGLMVFVAVAERLVLIALMLADKKGFSYVYARIFGVALQGACLYLVSSWSPRAMVAEVVRNGWSGARHLRFGYALLLKNASSPVGSSLIPAIGGKLFGAEAVGLVAWSHNLSSMIGLHLPQLSARVLIGASRQIGGSGDEIRHYAAKTLMSCTAVVGVAMAVLAALLPELLALVFQPRWSPAGPYFALSCLVMAAAILSTIYDALLVVLGFPGYAAAANWTCAVATVVTGTAFALLLGPQGLLWGHLAGTLLVIAMLHARVRRTCSLGILKNFLLPLLTSAALYALVLFTKGAWVRGIPSLVAALASYAAGGLALQAVVVPGFRDSVLALYRSFKRAPRNSPIPA